MTVLAPAKVNLLLKVLSKRPDGYHNLVSIVDIISVFDMISIDPVGEDTVIVTDDRGILPAGDKNTMYRAAMLLKERYSITGGVKIHVSKAIPIGSGLGGPSSNAAAVLSELARLWDIPVTDAELMDLGARIGADVPLFLYGKSCIMKGIGERISPVTLPKMWYVVVYPDIVMSTKDVYNGLKIVLTKGENDIKLRANYNSIQEVAAILENDLEEVGITMNPTSQAMKDELRKAGAMSALMSGSGSSIFGIFANEETARGAASRMGNKGSIFIAHSIQKKGRSYGDYQCEDISRE